MDKSKNNKDLQYGVGFIIAAIVCLYYFINVTYQKPFSDDWMMLEIARGLHDKPITEWLTVKDHFNQWRPLPFILKGLYLNGSSQDLALYNAFKVFVFGLVVVMTYFTSIVFFKDRGIALLASALMLLNPTNIGAVQNIDHIYKITGALFYGLSVLFIFLYFERSNVFYFLIFILSYLAAFFSDADAVAIFPAVIVIIMANYKKIPFSKTFSIILISISLLGIYLYLRNIIVGGVLSGGVSGKQDIVLNLNILINIVKMIASGLIFTISPYIYFKKPLYILTGLFFLLINLFLIFTAFVKSSEHDKIKMITLSGFCLIAMIPFILIRHVSEIYTIKPAYLLMIILSYSVLFLYNESKGIFKKTLMLYVVIMILSGAYSVIIKQDMMLQRGIMAESMAKSMMSVFPSPPHYSTINLLIDDCGIKDTYSDFINNDTQLAQLDNKYDYFIRYNYNDSTLNTSNNSKDVFNLRWDCMNKKFSLVDGRGNDF